MKYENVELHNIAEAVTTSGQSGVRLQRVPESVRENLEEPAANKVLNPAGSEIRFGITGGSAKITLSSDEGEGTARVFIGPFESKEVHIIGQEPVTIEVEVPEEVKDRLAALPDEIAATMPFSPSIFRIALFRGIVRLHDIEGNVRSPLPSETPKKTMMSYGTSITHGASASAFHLSYVAQTARRLGVDLINFGVGGACLCEAAFGDYLASLTQWDFATLALSVNMIGRGFSVEDFTSRVRYLVNKIATANPSKPVTCISIYPFFGDWGDLQPDAKAAPNEFRSALESVVKELSLPNLAFVDGREILTDVGGLTIDMIHPGDNGMITMGENLASKLSKLGATNSL